MKSLKFNLLLVTLVALVTIIFFNPYSRADVIFNNFGPGGTYNTDIRWIIGGGNWLGVNWTPAMPFTVSGNYTLDTIKLLIENAVEIPPSNNHVDVSLMSNNGGIPGTTIETFHFTNMGDMGPVGQYNLPIVGNSVLHPLLQQNTTYWLLASAGNDTSAGWNFNSTGHFGAITRKDNGQWLSYSPPSNTTGAFSITGTPVFTPPIGNIPIDPQTGERKSGIYGWNYNYDLSFINQQLLVDLDIYLKGDDPGDYLRNKWEQGIEDIWGSGYRIKDGTNYYPIIFNVDWVNDAASADKVVTVHNEIPWGSFGIGDNAYNMENWYTFGVWSPEYFITRKYQDEWAAHEAGHMFGLYDEYEGGALDPYNPIITSNALMADNQDVQERYYLGILDWLEGKTNRDLSLARAPIPPYLFDAPMPGFHDGPPGSPVPEPTTLLLLGSGLLGLWGFKKKFKK